MRVYLRLRDVTPAYRPAFDDPPELVDPLSVLRVENRKLSPGMILLYPFRILRKISVCLNPLFMRSMRFTVQGSSLCLARNPAANFALFIEETTPAPAACSR